MTINDTLVTHVDRRRLRSLVRRLRASGRGRRDHLAALADRLRRATVVSPDAIPRGVVTLDSRVALRDLDSRKRLVCTVTDPHDRTPVGDRVSVAGPAGAALLGKRVGHTVQWNRGATRRRFRLERILYQPEADGAFDL